ncbi:MAG: ankyrin repeat domain-containing protein [Cyanobium sp. MAG06]|nr:ankyrin repeat domain-containing protein [Cyanobium sp. MAG06]
MQKGQFDEQIKEQKRINKEQLSLQKSNTEVESLQNKINSCVDLRTKDREITFYESDGYDVNTGSLKSKDTKRKITGLTLNQAGYVCNAFYDNFEGVKQFFQEEFLYIPIDENEERSILHTTNLKNYTEIVEFIIKDKLLYYNKNLFETLSKGKKYTPLMYAVIDNNLNSVQYLLSKGVEIDTRLPDQNFLGDTAFTLAVKYNRREIAKYLKDNGADINIRLNGPFAGRNLFTHFSTLIDKEKLDLVIDLEVDPKIKIGENYFNSLYEILFINDNSKTEDLRLEYAKKIIEKYPNTLEDIKNNEKGEDIVALLNSNISDGRYKIAKYLLDLFPELKNNKDYRTFMDIFLSGVENNCSDKITNTSHKYLEELFK